MAKRARMALLLAALFLGRMPAQPLTCLPGYDSLFAAYGVTGSFLVYNQALGSWAATDTARARQRFIPASTFKIFNSLAAFESGVADSENFTLPWDSVQRQLPAWNKDLTIKEAFAVSAVWFYQEVARRVGAERMQGYLAKEQYGNADMSGGVDRFWLDGGLRISQTEQIAFLMKLCHGKLGFSPRAQQLTKNIMLRETGERYKLFAKTGLASAGNLLIGWYVGYVERADNIWFFAINLQDLDRPGSRIIPARLEISRAILTRLGVW